MGSSVSVCFYLIIGIGIAVALWLVDDRALEHQRLFRSLTAPLFWPLYVPLLFAGNSANDQRLTTPLRAGRPDGMADMIEQVETELDRALRSLNGWAEEVLATEQHRIVELRAAWRQQADFIRELDQLLDQAAMEAATVRANQLPAPHSETGTGQPGIAQSATASTAPRVPDATEISHRARIEEYERTRDENIQKLKQIRRHLLDELMTTLAWVRELVTMIHLAKYTGEPASRAQELVHQIAAAIEGVSDVSQQKT